MRRIRTDARSRTRTRTDTRTATRTATRTDLRTDTVARHADPRPGRPLGAAARIGG